ncbi:MAG: rubredoxin [Haliea sp.]
MRAWECQSCGYVYHEEKGDPVNDIAPGTCWEDIPGHWFCPECGASKGDFMLLEP